MKTCEFKDGACIHCQDEVSKLETINKELLNALRLFVAHSAPPECAIWRHVDDVARAAIANATKGEAK